MNDLSLNLKRFTDLIRLHEGPHTHQLTIALILYAYLSCKQEYEPTLQSFFSQFGDDPAFAEAKQLAAIAKQGYYLPSELTFSQLVASLPEEADNSQLVDKVQKAFACFNEKLIAEKNPEASAALGIFKLDVKAENAQLIFDFLKELAELLKPTVPAQEKELTDQTTGQTKEAEERAYAKLTSVRSKLSQVANSVTDFFARTGSHAEVFTNIHEVATHLAVIQAQANNLKVRSIYAPVAKLGLPLRKTAQLLRTQTDKLDFYGHNSSDSLTWLFNAHLLLEGADYPNLHLTGSLENLYFKDASSKQAFALGCQQETVSQSGYDLIVSEAQSVDKVLFNRLLSNHRRLQDLQVQTGDDIVVVNALDNLSKEGACALIVNEGEGLSAQVSQYLVDGNYLDSVVNLPECFGSSIYLLSKHKTSQDVLFIDLTDERNSGCDPEFSQRHLLKPQVINLAVQLFQSRYAGEVHSETETVIERVVERVIERVTNASTKAETVTESFSVTASAFSVTNTQIAECNYALRVGAYRGIPEPNVAASATEQLSLSEEKQTSQEQVALAKTSKEQTSEAQTSKVPTQVISVKDAFVIERKPYGYFSKNYPLGKIPVYASGVQPKDFIDYPAPEGDAITVILTGYAGDVYYRQGPLVTETCLCLRERAGEALPVEAPSLKFGYYCLLALKPYLAKFTAGNFIKSLKASTVTDLKLPLVAPEQQQQMVRLLDNYTDFQETLQAQLTCVQDLINAIVQRSFAPAKSVDKLRKLLVETKLTSWDYQADTEVNLATFVSTHAPNLDLSSWTPEQKQLLRTSLEQYVCYEPLEGFAELQKSLHFQKGAEKAAAGKLNEVLSVFHAFVDLVQSIEGMVWLPMNLAGQEVLIETAEVRRLLQKLNPRARAASSVTIQSGKAELADKVEIWTSAEKPVLVESDIYHEGELIMMNRTGAVPRVNYSAGKQLTVFNICFEPRHQVSLGKFLCYSARRRIPYLKAQTRLAVTGISVTAPSDIKNLLVAIPPLAQQQKLIKKLAGLESYAQVLEELLASTQILFTDKLQKSVGNLTQKLQ